MSRADKTLLLYQRPMLLRQDQHRSLKLAYEGSNYSFAAESNSFLLAASEVPEAVLHYPVVFIGKEGGAFSLAVLTGLTDRQNLFVDAGGKWSADTYVPAFVRRYPFVLLEEGPDHLSVGYDAAYSGFSEIDGEPLFEPDGSTSPLLKHAIGFLEGFHAQMTATRAFADKLAALGLLVPRIVEVSSGPSKAPRVLQGFFAVDPDRLAALPAATLAELAAGPELGWIYLHLNSLRLVSRLAARVDVMGAKSVFPADATVQVGKLPVEAKAAISVGTKKTADAKPVASPASGAAAPRSGNRRVPRPDGGPTR